LTQDHTNILKMYEIFEEENLFYIVTELCVGKELFDCIIEARYFK
jgi:calcium-dependent protein kinase